MTMYLSSPYLFAFGCYTSALMMLLLIIFAVLRNQKGVKVSSIGLLLGVCFVVSVILLGDWRVPNCYDSGGNLMSDLPQCQFI